MIRFNYASPHLLLAFSITPAPPPFLKWLINTLTIGMDSSESHFQCSVIHYRIWLSWNSSQWPRLPSSLPSSSFPCPGDVLHPVWEPFPILWPNKLLRVPSTLLQPGIHHFPSILGSFTGHSKVSFFLVPFCGQSQALQSQSVPTGVFLAHICVSFVHGGTQTPKEFVP